jgi:hypothetical protein
MPKDKSLSHEETKDLLRSRFEEFAGSQRCREIKNRKLLSCVQCVELAATVLSENEHPMRLNKLEVE